MSPSISSPIERVESTPTLSVRGVVVDFPGVRALDRVDFDAHTGEIHALMGENGAGKSTLINVLSGLYPPREGTIHLDGREIRPRTPREAQAVGLSTVHQEIDLVPAMSVADNICLGRHPTRTGLIRQGATRRRAEAALASLGMYVDVSGSLGDHPIAVQQMVAIARAMDIDARVLILDEPTSSLDATETDHLFRVLQHLRDQGLCIVFVSHFLDQVYRLADRITVLRNGMKVGVWEVAALPKPALIEAMTGRTIEREPQNTASGSTDAAPEALLEVDGLGRRAVLAPTSLTVRAGESLGLAGLRGSGRTELARLIFGADAADEGQVRVGGARIPAGSVRDAIARGLAFTPEDRKAEGLVLDLSVRENILLAMQARRGALRPLRPPQQMQLADHYIRSLNIRTPDAETPVRNLSGGNQQKVLLARWLAVQPRVLILDEPTRGIDVGARAEIESLIARLRAEGLAIVLISSELDEIVRTCGRVLILRDRRTVGELEGTRITESAILAVIAGAGTVAGSHE